MDVEPLRRRSRLLRTLTTIVFSVLVLALMLELAGVARSPHPVPAAGYMLIYRAPMLFYLLAIWTVRLAFGSIARGALFDMVVPVLLTRLGLCLLLGATTNVLISPSLLRLFYGPSHGALANFDPAAITLGVIGLMLVLVARLLAQAAAMRTELDEIL